MKAGTKVRLIQPVIEGEVKERKFVDDEEQNLVVWPEPDGEGGTHLVQRWFSVAQLQEVKP